MRRRPAPALPGRRRDAADISHRDGGGPRFETLAPANHAAIADAWILGFGRTPRTIVADLRKRLVGGDTLAKNDAIALVERMLAPLQGRAQEPFDGTIVPVADARIETLYFDGPAAEDWPAFAFDGDRAFLALDRERMLR
jgi:hypothetical protein